MNKRIITEYQGHIMTAVMENDKVISLDFDDSEPSMLGSIYVGKVKNIVNNIEAAFVDIGCGDNCYYSLKENKHHIFLNQKTNDKLVEGDEILVQVSKEAAKTKAPIVTSQINFSGKYAVLILNSPGIGFSSKIKNKAFKEAVKEELSSLPIDDYGIIVRTNAEQAFLKDISEEVMQLVFLAARVTDSARFSSCYTCVYSSVRPYIAKIRDSHNADEIIVTDSELVYSQVMKEFWDSDQELCERVKKYDDSYPLMKLYSLETVLEKALSKKVWLKSGGYLYIEPTEALTVIDVNTGKFLAGKDSEKTFLKINLEAAEEIAVQLKLRNISGIIVVDFIDMKNKEDTDTLINALKNHLRNDTVKTTFVDITSLGLAEITRQKIKKPIYEVLIKG